MIKITKVLLIDLGTYQRAVELNRFKEIVNGFVLQGFITISSWLLRVNKLAA